MKVYWEIQLVLVVASFIIIILSKFSFVSDPVLIVDIFHMPGVSRDMKFNISYFYSRLSSN